VPTQNVNLTPALDAFVKKQVFDGVFNNASEVHRSALAAMARQEEERQLRLENLRREINLGINDIEAGRFTKISGEGELRSMLDGCFENAVRRLEQDSAEAAT
jgi:antitoxin ParD1/3/4